MSQLKEGQTPHQVLGLGREASVEDMKKAYRKCALANHPDKVGDTPVAKRNMQIINDAYEKLNPNSPYYTATHASAAETNDTGEFESARPERKRERSSKKQRPRRESNHQFDPEEGEYFFGRGFESPFHDFNDHGFNFWGSDGNTENSSSLPKMHLSASKKGRRKAKDFRDHQANESADRRDRKAEAERGDKGLTPNLWEKDSFWKVFVEAARPPVNERFDFYPDGDVNEMDKSQSGCSAKFLVVPGFNAVSRQLDRIHKILGKLVGGLCAISRWLVDVVEIDRQSHRFTLTKDAVEAGVRTAAKHTKLAKVANALHLSGWESNPEAVVCFMDELVALRRYLKAVESNLNEVLLDFTEISIARLDGSKLFGSERRSVLWAALSGFKDSIERLEQHRGARFVFSEYAGR